MQQKGNFIIRFNLSKTYLARKKKDVNLIGSIYHGVKI